MTDDELAAIASRATLHVVESPSVIAKACLRQGSFALGNRGMSTTGGRPRRRKRDSDIGGPPGGDRAAENGTPILEGCRGDTMNRNHQPAPMRRTLLLLPRQVKINQHRCVVARPHQIARLSPPARLQSEHRPR